MTAVWLLRRPTVNPVSLLVVSITNLIQELYDLLDVLPVVQLRESFADMDRKQKQTYLWMYRSQWIVTIIKVFERELLPCNGY